MSERKGQRVVAPPPPPLPPPGVGISETRGGGTKEPSFPRPRRRPLSAQVVKLMSQRIQGALSDITDAYPEVRQWCYALPYRNTDKPLC